MAELIDLPIFAPIPIGHHVSIVTVEVSGLLTGGWSPLPTPIVCDENTRILYSDRLAALSPETTYDRIVFADANLRASPTVPIKRGVVVSCLALSSHGGHAHFHTYLGIDAR